MSRANSLKKAIRQLVEHTEQAVDEQNKTCAGPSFLVTPPVSDEQQLRASKTLDIPGLPRPTDTLKVVRGKLPLTSGFCTRFQCTSLQSYTLQ